MMYFLAIVGLLALRTSAQLTVVTTFCSPLKAQQIMDTCRALLDGLADAQDQADQDTVCSIVQEFLNCESPENCPLVNELLEEQHRYRLQYSDAPRGSQALCRFSWTGPICDIQVMEQCNSQISDFNYLSHLSTFDAIRINRVFKGSCEKAGDLENCIEGAAHNCPSSVQDKLTRWRQVVIKLQSNACTSQCLTTDTELTIRQLVNCHDTDHDASHICSANVHECFRQVAGSTHCYFYTHTLPNAMCPAPSGGSLSGAGGLPSSLALSLLVAALSTYLWRK